MVEEERLTPLHEGALLVEYPGLSDEEANRAAVAAAGALLPRDGRGPLGSALWDAVPGARTLLLLCDPHTLDARALRRVLAQARERPPEASASRTVRIPVCYGGEAAQDLAELASAARITPEELARRHAAARYRVAFLGFAPGFAYLSGLPPELHASRLATPRPRVPAGAVGIGGPYTAVYPGQSPGGWRLIGRSPSKLFDEEADPPALLAPGDEVLFEPVGPAELARRLASAEPASASPRGRPLFRVLAPGLSTSVQGAPRYGHGAFGVPPGGAMDVRTLAEGNARLGNAFGAAALEMTLVGPEVECLAPCRVTLAGPEIEADRDGARLAVDVPLVLAVGQRLKFGRVRGGARAYLCVEGGLEPSRAVPAPRLSRGDLVAASAATASGGGEADSAWPSTSLRGEAIRVVVGPQREHFGRESLERFLSSRWRVSATSDRRGVRLEGEALTHRLPADIPPEGTALGAIQVPPDGRPIVLGPDRPVTGGYAKIATVIGADWHRVAQAPPGWEVWFRAVSIEEALAAAGVADPRDRMARP